MMKRTVKTAILLAIGAAITTIASLSFSLPALMPFLGAGVIYPLYLWLLKEHSYHRAMAWVLWWAICQSVAVISVTILAPEKAADAVLNGSIYTQGMFNWILTGEGAEDKFRLFLPIHLQEYVIFSLLSLVTFGSAALILGTYLLNYMNFYVGRLIYESSYPWLAAIVGWPPWSMFRVIGYIATGLALTVLALNLIRYWRKLATSVNFPRHYFLLGLGLLLGDLSIKAIISPSWRKVLYFALTGSAE